MVIKYVLQKVRADKPNLAEADLYAQIRSYAETNLFGVDVNDRMARVSKMNMIMHGDGHGGIAHEHGLNIGYTQRIPLKFGDATKILSNPPFRGRELDPDQLEKFEVAKSESGKVNSVGKALPFVELIVKLLDENGTAGLVLPNGIFNSQSLPFRKLREIIWSKCEIIAIIGLPHWVFFHTGCDVQGALLFIRRTDKPREDYSVFMDWAEHVGYDAAGHKTPDQNDLPSILARLNKPTKKNLFKASVLRRNGRIDPQYYQPSEHAARQSAVLRAGTVPLTSLVVPGTEYISRSKNNTTTVRYIEVGDTDKVNGKIVGFTTCEVRKLPARAKYIIHENNLLIPNHRNSIKAGRSVVLVPPEHEGTISTSRFIVVRPQIPSLYLYHILNLDFIKKAMLRLVSGSSSTEVKFEQLKDILVPVPADGDYDLFIDEVEAAQAEIAGLEEALQEKRTALRGKFSSLYGDEGPEGI